MYNWSTDTKELEKDPAAYECWQLEQLINFGLRGAKIEEQKLRRHFETLNLDPARRKFLSLLLYGATTADKKTKYPA